MRRHSAYVAVLSATLDAVRSVGASSFPHHCKPRITDCSCVFCKSDDVDDDVLTFTSLSSNNTLV